MPSSSHWQSMEGKVWPQQLSVPLEQVEPSWEHGAKGSHDFGSVTMMVGVDTVMSGPTIAAVTTASVVTMAAVVDVVALAFPPVSEQYVPAPCVSGQQ